MRRRDQLHRPRLDDPARLTPPVLSYRQPGMIPALPMQQQMNAITLDVCHDLTHHDPDDMRYRDLEEAPPAQLTES